MAKVKFLLGCHAVQNIYLSIMSDGVDMRQNFVYNIYTQHVQYVKLPMCDDEGYWINIIVFLRMFFKTISFICRCHISISYNMKSYNCSIIYQSMISNTSLWISFQAKMINNDGVVFVIEGSVYSYLLWKKSTDSI